MFSASSQVRIENRNFLIILDFSGAHMDIVAIRKQSCLVYQSLFATFIQSNVLLFMTWRIIRNFSLYEHFQHLSAEHCQTCRKKNFSACDLCRIVIFIHPMQSFHSPSYEPLTFPNFFPRFQLSSVSDNVGGTFNDKSGLWHQTSYSMKISRFLPC